MFRRIDGEIGEEGHFTRGEARAIWEAILDEPLPHLLPVIVVVPNKLALVEGGSRSHYYVCRAKNGELRCSCRSFRFGGGKPCKHVDLWVTYETKRIQPTHGVKVRTLAEMFGDEKP